MRATWRVGGKSCVPRGNGEHGDEPTLVAALASGPSPLWRFPLRAGSSWPKAGAKGLSVRLAVPGSMVSCMAVLQRSADVPPLVIIGRTSAAPAHPTREIQILVIVVGPVTELRAITITPVAAAEAEHK